MSSQKLKWLATAKSLHMAAFCAMGSTLSTTSNYEPEMFSNLLRLHYVALREYTQSHVYRL